MMLLAIGVKELGIKSQIVGGVPEPPGPPPGPPVRVNESFGVPDIHPITQG